LKKRVQGIEIPFKDSFSTMFAGGVIKDSYSLLVSSSSFFSIKHSSVFFVEEKFISIFG